MLPHHQPATAKKPKKKKSGFRIVHQRLVLEVEFASQRLVGYTEIVIAPSAGTLSRISLNCSFLQIHRVYVNNIETRVKIQSVKNLQEQNTRSLESYWAHAEQEQDLSESGEIVIGVPHALRVPVAEDREAQAEPLVIRIAYELSYPGQGIQFVVPCPQFPFRPNQVFTTHARGPALWFPCKDSLSERCTFDFQLTCPAGMIVIASGRLKDKTYVDASQEKITFSFSCEIPIAARAFGFVCGAYQAIPGNEDVTHFVSTSANKSSAQKVLVADTAAVFQIYEECVSSSYPYESYKQVFVDDAYDNTMSFAGLSILSSSLLYGQNIIDQAFSTRYCLAFALAESWTTAIAIASVADLWILDGIARYLTSLYVQSSLGYNESEYNRMIDCIQVSETDTCGNTPVIEGSVEWRDQNCELYVGDELTTACLAEERIVRGARSPNGIFTNSSSSSINDRSNSNLHRLFPLPSGISSSNSTSSSSSSDEKKITEDLAHQDYYFPCRPLNWNGFGHTSEMYGSLMSKKAGVVFRMMQNITNTTNFRKIIARIFEESGYHIQDRWQFGRAWRQVESVSVPGYIDEIPLCLVRMRDFLVKKGGLEIQNLFSVSPPDNSIELQTLKEEINLNSLHFTCENPHFIAHLIKQWFGSLPTRLLNECEITEIQQAATNAQLARDLLMKLPGRTILEWILDLGVELTVREVINKMSPLRFAQSLAPFLIEQQADWNTTKQHNATVSEWLVLAMEARKANRNTFVVPHKTQKVRIVEQLTTKTFLKLAKTISNETQAIDSFALLWIKCDGYPLMKAQFRFHHKKKETEVAIEQEHPHGIRFSGHLLFRIHEEDRAWEAVKRIDEDKVDYQFPCSSRLRRNRKRKQVEDLSSLEVDELLQRFIGTPVLWVRVDPYYMWFRPFVMDMGGSLEPVSGERMKLLMQECEVMWLLQLTKERDVVAQCEAIQGLARMSNNGSFLLSFNALIKTVEDSRRAFHRVRSMAAFALSAACLRNASTREEEVRLIVEKLLDYFSLKHFEQHNKMILKPNNFSDYAEYMVKKSLCFALSRVRISGLTPRNIVELMLVLLQNNDNSKNTFSDSFYLFSVIRAVGNLRLSDSVFESQIWSQLKRYLDFDRVVPSYQNLVTQAVLEAACRFEIADQLSPEYRLDFKHFLQYGNFRAVRTTAFRCLTALLPLRPDLFGVLLSALENEDSSVNLVANTTFARSWALGSSVEHADVPLLSEVKENEPLPVEILVRAHADVFCITLPRVHGFFCNLSSLLEFQHVGGCVTSSLSVYARADGVGVSVRPVIQFLDLEDKIKEHESINCLPCVVPNSHGWVRLRWYPTLRNIHSRGILKFVISWSDDLRTGAHAQPSIKLFLSAPQLEPKPRATPFFKGQRTGCQGVRLQYAEIWSSSTSWLCSLLEHFRVSSPTNHDYMERLWVLLNESPDMSFRWQLQRLYRGLWGSKVPAVADAEQKIAKTHSVPPEESAAHKRGTRARNELKTLRSSRQVVAENRLVLHRTGAHEVEAGEQG